MIEGEKNSLWFIEFQEMLRTQQGMDSEARIMETSLDRQDRRGFSLYNYVLTDLDGKYMGVDAPKGAIPRDNSDTVRRQKNILDKDKRNEEDAIIYGVVHRAKEFKLGWKHIQNTLSREYGIEISNNKILRVMREVAKENN